MNDQTENPFDHHPGPSCHVVTDDWKVRMETNISDIRLALVGDKRMGHRGVIMRVDDLEKKIARQEVKIITWSGICAGAVLAYDYLRTKASGG